MFSGILDLHYYVPYISLRKFLDFTEKHKEKYFFRPWDFCKLKEKCTRFTLHCSSKSFVTFREELGNEYTPNIDIDFHQKYYIGMSSLHDDYTPKIEGDY